MKLLSSDEITIEASLDAMKCSSVWAEYLSLYPQEDADDEEIIMPVALRSEILEKMLEWGEHYKVGSCTYAQIIFNLLLWKFICKTWW